MSERLEFFKSLFPTLNLNNRYIAFNYLLKFESLGTVDHLDILLKKEAVTPVLSTMKKLTIVDRIQVNHHFSCSEAVIHFNSGASLLLNFIHQFVYKNLFYLDIAEVMQEGKYDFDREHFRPSIVHALEYAVLTSYLGGKGLSERRHRYFEDFHFLVKEDLIDFFNEKYHTHFRQMDDLLEFSKQDQEHMLAGIRRLPANAFLGSINRRWKYFFHTRSRASVL